MSLRDTGHMVKHLRDRHPELDLMDPSNIEAERRFTMKIHRRYKYAIDCQVGEALCIAKARGWIWTL